ncbi:hypothetical protein [Burkholderia cepacia]|uniref:hypothetical protein n=1 Tax=Burkholderia cepacia TaxID=292 RepID=UPI00158D4271|nr:hypothetical protein [Burkholderia cepacia]
MDKVNELYENGLTSLSKLEDMKKVNLTKLVETQIDFWEKEIFPRCELYGIPRYEFLCENVFSKSGIDVTAKRLGDIVYRVKKKRNKNV